MLNKLISILLVLVCVFSLNAFSATIIKVGKTKVLINPGSDNLSVGEYYYLLDEKGERVGGIKIVKLAEGKAYGDILKGKARENYVLELVPKKEKKGSNKYISLNNQFSINVVSISNKLNVLVSDGVNSETISTTGSSMGLEMSYDRKFGSFFAMGTFLNYEPFKSTGQSQYLACNSLTSYDCTTTINYVGTGLKAKLFGEIGPFVLWLGGGVQYKLPLSKVSTALLESDIISTITYFYTFGFDYKITEKFVIPVGIEQQMFLKSETAELKSAAIKAGIGYNF
jgi:hypothetical protein